MVSTIYFYTHKYEDIDMLTPLIIFEQDPGNPDYFTSREMFYHTGNATEIVQFVATVTLDTVVRDITQAVLSVGTCREDSKINVNLKTEGVPTTIKEPGVESHLTAIAYRPGEQKATFIYDSISVPY